MYLVQKKVLIENATFKGWISTIIHNIFLSKHKRIIRIEAIEPQKKKLYYINTSQDLGFDITEGSYTIAEINRQINSFTDEYKIPYLMYIAGYRYEEIANRLHLPICIAKSRIFFTHYKLLAMLKDHKHQGK